MRRVPAAAGGAYGTGALYRTDGTATGTSLLATIPWRPRAYFTAGAAVGGRFVVPVADERDGALWVTEGTPSTTTELLRASDTFHNLQGASDGRLAFTTGSAVVTSDGTKAGTKRQVVGRGSPGAVSALPGKGFVVSSWDAKAIYLLGPSGDAISLEPGKQVAMNLAGVFVNGGLVFPGPTDAHGMELLFTDGTVSGTRQVSDVAPGAASSDPNGLLVGLGRLWFAAEDAGGDRELYSLPLAAIP
jgi:ELWxxDGT repeat protein